MLQKEINSIFADPECGNVHRIKGIVKDNEGAVYEINTTRNETKVGAVDNTDAVLIVIGEALNKEQIAKYLGKPTI